MKKPTPTDGSGEWDENEHPRDDDGKFASGGVSRVFEKTKDLNTASSSEKLTNERKSDIVKASQRTKLMCLKDKPEGTYNLETGETVSYNSGYQVSFQQTSDTYTDEEYDAKVAEIIARTGSIAHGGVFGEPEVSFHTNNINEAMEIAKVYNQHSVFDWGKKELILNPHYVQQKNKIKR